MKNTGCILLVIFLLACQGLMGEEYRFRVSVSNDWSFNKVDEPVVISLKDLPVAFTIQSAVIRCNNVEIASQLDDLDCDRKPDELVFVLDIPANSSKTLDISLSSERSDKTYPSRVFAEMLLSDKNGKHQPITSLTTPGESDVYNLLHHHGPAFESEQVAYRIYFDKKQTVDIYGKFNKGLEIEECQFYPTDEQLARGFGDDVLRVSGSCGLGTLKGWDGSKATHIEPVAYRTETILVKGPVRTVTDVKVTHWEYQGSVLDMTVRYLLYAGHRDCEVQVFFSQPLKQETFAIGIQRIKDSASFSDKKGLLACWGTDWPVNDTVKYAKETVGLALYLPEKIVKEETRDNANYLYLTESPGMDSFNYHIMFTSKKETFGYADKEAWFAYVGQWKEELQKPCTIQVIRPEALSYAIRMADSEMARCPESWQLDFQRTLKWDYCHGLELQAFLDLYEYTGDKKYFDYALAYADTMIHEDGSITAYKVGEYNIDRVNTGKMLFRLYDYTRDEKIKKAIDLLRSQLDTHPRNEDGGFWHKDIYPHQVWLDGVYMGTPFLAEYAYRYNRPQDFKDVINQILVAARHTYDPSNGLYRHACDVSRQMFWADKVTGQSKHAWGRAMGWYAMGIVDALDFIPPNEPGRDSVLFILDNLVTQIKRLQDKKTGLWYQVLDRSGDKGNYVESSCSAMFMYSLLKAVRMGYIDASYLEVAEKAYNGYKKEFIEFDKDGLMNITKGCAVAGLGGKDNRSGDYNYYINELIRANDPKAVGPFIMAMLERSLLVE